MRKIFIVLAMVIANFAIEAQVKTPQPSPNAVVKQVVGLTDVELDYSRPSAKGRTIFGDLVPFGKQWRTGANANSTISFSDDVVIDGKILKKENMLFSLCQKRITGILYSIRIRTIGDCLKLGMKQK